jgi:hypothetical protein
MSLDISILDEIDSPVELDQKKSRKLFFFEYDDKDASIDEVMKSYIEEKTRSGVTPNKLPQKSKEDSKIYKGILYILFPVLILLYLYIALRSLLIALSKDLRHDSLNDGHEWFPIYENTYILSNFIISFSIIFCFLIILVAIIGTSSKDYTLDCLQYREVKDFTVEDMKGIRHKSKGFYFKAIDLDWNLHKLFAIETSGLLFLISVFLACEGLSVSFITRKLNSIANDPTEKWGLNTSLLISIFTLLGIIALIPLLYLLINKTYNYTKIKSKVTEIVESKLFLMDAFISKPSTTKELSELEQLRVLQLQNKLYRIRDNLNQLPLLPITNWNLIVYGFAGLSALFSFLGIFLDQLLKLIFVSV